MKKFLSKEKKCVKNFKRNEKIGFFAFLGITSSMLITIYEYPLFASSGWSIILFILIAGACFFLPVVIATSEMSTIKKWEKGGIFIWIKNTLGRKWGFLAIFYQWFAISIAFMAMLYFISSALGFTFGGVSGFNWLTEGNGGLLHEAPFQLSSSGNLNQFQLDQIKNINSNYGINQISPLVVAGALFGVITLVFVVITLTQLFGIKYTAFISKIGFVVGIIIPIIILIVLGFIYIAQGHPTIENIQGGINSTSHFTRGLNISNTLTLFSAVILSFVGIEASSSLVTKLKNSSKNYPLAMLILFVIVLIFSIFAAIMISISSSDISQTGGLLVALVNLFIQIIPGFNPNTAIIAVQVIAFFLSFGIVAKIAAWILSPARGLRFAAEKQLLPPIFAKTNKYDVPIANIIVQTCLVIFWNLVITVGLGFNGSGSFQAGIAISVIIYLLCYFIFFSAYIKLAFKAPKIDRIFKIKHQKLQIFIGILGLVLSIFSFIISFINPGIDNAIWFSVLIILSIISILIPWIIYKLYYRYQIKNGVDVSNLEKIPALVNE